MPSKARVPGRGDDSLGPKGYTGFKFDIGIRQPHLVLSGRWTHGYRSCRGLFIGGIPCCLPTFACQEALTVLGSDRARRLQV